MPQSHRLIPLKLYPNAASAPLSFQVRLVTLIISFEPLAVTTVTDLCLLAGALAFQLSTKAVAKPKLLGLAV